MPSQQQQQQQLWMRDVIAPAGVAATSGSLALTPPPLKSTASTNTITRSQQPARLQHSAPRSPPVIGIVGGSISAGMGSGWVRPGRSYGELLAASLGASVYNRAIAATGSALPSYCLDALLPQAVDLLIIETAPNDGAE